MKTTRKITINGQEREAIFTLRLFAHAAERGISIEFPTQETLEKDPMAWVEPYINMIYVGLLTGCDRAGVTPDFDKMDVEIWATEHPDEFGEVVRDMIQPMTSGQKPSEDEKQTPGNDAEVKKKSSASTTTKSKVSWLARAVTRAKKSTT